MEEEKKQSVLAKMKFDRMPQTQQQRATSGDKRRKQTVSFDTGFVSSLSGNNYVSSDDPIVQQVLPTFISATLFKYPITEQYRKKHLDCN